MKQIYFKPEITEERIEQIRAMIRDNPGWRRTKISKEICELWNWRGHNGQIKDISCRDMLRDLDGKGIIKLPKSMHKSSGKGTRAGKVTNLEHDTTPIECSLKEIMPVRIEMVTNKEDLGLFKSYVNQYHYLGYDRNIGENMKYITHDRYGRPLSCLMFGSAAWTSRPRDEFIGWTKETRKNNLQFTTGNSRFLVFPWVRVPYLASHTLSLVAKRIKDDWMSKYGHPVYLLETFVEKDRFEGTCYKASNWIHVGDTTGLGRNSTAKSTRLPVKAIYMHPLVKDFRKKLGQQEEIGL